MRRCLNQKRKGREEKEGFRRELAGKKEEGRELKLKLTWEILVEDDVPF